jgi:hypothetical protein
MKSDLDVVREFYDQTLDTPGFWRSLTASQKVKVILRIPIGLSHLPDDMGASVVAHDAHTKSNLTLDSRNLPLLLDYGLYGLRSRNRQDFRRTDICALLLLLVDL